MLHGDEPTRAERLLAELRRRNLEAQARVQSAIEELEWAAGGTGLIATLGAVLPGSTAGGSPRPEPDGTPYLLLADPHDGTRAALAGLLRERGHRVVEAGSSDGLPSAGAPLPALVVLDPGPYLVRALEAVARMRREPATAAVAVLMLAPILSASDRDHAVAAGCLDCLPKPVSPADLLAAVDHAMARLSAEPLPRQVGAAS